MITATQTDSLQAKADYNLGYVWLISVVAAMGGLLFGWDWVVIGGAKPFFERYFHLTSEAQIGWANSCALIGCLAGALVAGVLSDKFGRKRLLLVAALLFALTSIGNALAHNFTIFIAWRMLGGVAIGLASNLSPMYIAEVAPAQMRGKLVAINQLTIVVGILLAQYINWFLVRYLPAGATDEFIRDSWFGQQGWRWMFGLTAIPALLFLIGTVFVPESPRWLAKHGKSERARGVLTKIGGVRYADEAIADIKSTLASEESQHVRFADLLDPRMRKVRHQRHLQLCRGNFPGRWLRHFERAQEHRLDRLGEPRVYVRGAGRGGSRWPAAAHAAGCGRTRRHLRRDGLLLCRWCQRTPDAAPGARGDRLLRDVARAGDVGGHLRDLPQSHPRGRNGGGGVIALDRLFHPHLHVPDPEREARIRRNLLALRGDLRRRIFLHQTQAPGDQGQDVGADRA
jgi:hypothetical protein